MSKLGDRIREHVEKRWPKIQAPNTETVVADGRAWVKVRAPKPWRPKGVGDVLVGELVGRSTRPGDNGTVYGVSTFRTEQGTFTISGVVITSLLESSGVPIGGTVRIVYTGDQTSLAGRTYRVFELFVAKDEVNS